MERGFLEHARGERLIGTGRLLLSGFALVVLRLDPDVAQIRPFRLLPIAAVFAIYSIVTLVLALRAPMVTGQIRLGLHAIDFLFFTLFIQLTHASISPFFIFFLFSLLSALLRFGVRGLLATAGVSTVTYIALAFLDANIRSDPGYLIMRTTSLAVATLLLAYAGAYHERVRDELTKLAAWPRVGSEERDPLVRETLLLARDLLDAPRAILMWEEEEEPWVEVATLEGERFETRRERPEFLEEIIDRRAERLTFLDRLGTSEMTVVSAGAVSTRPFPGLTETGRAFFGRRSVLSAVVSAQTVVGRIFFVGREDLQYEDVSVAEIIARLVAARLDHLNVGARMRAAAVNEERLRVARNLHDGLLQSLTGASLQLEMIHRLMATDVEGARERLRNVQDLIAEDQRELRALISGLRPRTQTVRPPLQVRLADLADRFERQWDLQVSVTVDPLAQAVPDTLGAEIYSIINEGVANAAKHAHAHSIDVTVVLDLASVTITIRDDGQGFPFLGEFTLAQLDAERRGPVTLKERVASLGGDMQLRSTEEGSAIVIRLARDASRPATLTA